MAALAAIRLRGQMRLNSDIADTMRSLRLTRANHCVILPVNEQTTGQLRHAKDYITFGTVEAKAIADLLRARGRLEGDAPLTDAVVAKSTPFKTIDELAQALADGKVKYWEIPGIKPIFRLSPPRGGHKGGLKRSFQVHGGLGNRGDKMADLIARMI